MDRTTRSRPAGFTLIEMVIALMLIGIVAGMTAVFMQLPVTSNIYSRHRLALADSVDAAQRLLDLELRRAVPRSVRISQAGGVTYIEFLATRAVGRFRAAGGGAACAGGDPLRFGMGAPNADTCFTTLGPVLSHDGSAIAVGQDYLVVNHSITDAAGNPTPQQNVYLSGAGNGRGKARITGYTASAVAGPSPEDRIQFASTNFPVQPATGNRFYVVTGPVTYACNPAAGQLRRYGNYAITAAPPAARGGGFSIVAGNVSACRLQYHNGAGDTGFRERLVSLSIDFTRAIPGETALEHAYLFAQMPTSVTP